MARLAIPALAGTELPFPRYFLLAEGFICGLSRGYFLLRFFYFFNADKNIGRRLMKKFGNPRNFLRTVLKPNQERDENALPVYSYFSEVPGVSAARGMWTTTTNITWIISSASTTLRP